MPEASATQPSEPDSSAQAGPLADRLVVTRHSTRIGEVDLKYSVTAGTIVLREEAEKDGVSEGEKAKAELFFIAYTRDEPRRHPERPLTFSFNGGPGSSSVWLHLGLLGPKRVQMDEIGNPTPPPYRLVPNEYSLLDQTDLVFIDPVSTGYSRPVAGEKAKDFHELKKDVASVGDFIRLYTSRYGRWGSPKFLIGESYGTTRAAGLSSYLQERHGMNLNGIMLVSSILDFQTARFEAGNDLPYLLFLPTYTAAAHYHRRLGKRLQGKPLREVLDEAEAFALGPYASALLKGSSLDEAEKKRVVGKLAAFTGLSESYVLSSNLRIEIHRFCKELLRSERRTVGRLDARFSGRDRDSAGERPSYDPSYATIQGPYTATFNDYVRGELGFETDRSYEILTGLYQNWRWNESENKYVNVAENLRQAMSQNPHLKVHVASGYFDLATPYFATEYTVSHLGLEPELTGNLSLSYYEAGHMMYVQLESLKKLKRELSAFMKSAVPRA